MSDSSKNVMGVEDREDEVVALCTCLNNSLYNIMVTKI